MNQVFISYRQEDDAYAATVRSLADQFKNQGLPVVLDQFFLDENPGGPDEGWPRWCEAHAEKSACVLICCSRGWFDSYRGVGAPGSGLGAALEAAVFSQGIYNEKQHNARIRLVILNNFSVADIPPRLQAWHIFRPSAQPADFDLMTRWIRKRLAMPASPATLASKVVYIEEARYDMRAERANLVSVLKDKAWTVLPDAAVVEKPLGDMLRDSLAYIQLLESYPAGDQSFRSAFDEARARPRFRFRHDKILLDSTDPAARAFLTEKEVIPGPFDDFKVSLLTELDALLSQQHAPKPYASRNLLVRVIIRANNPDLLWDYVFNAIDLEPDMRAALLEGSENFQNKQDPSVPCHGYLIVCDAAAQEGGILAPRPDLEHCMQIQLGEKNDIRRPPVGLLYWPPPSPPAWSRLARVSPPKMQRLIADTAAALRPFFDEVRRSAT